MNKPYYTTIIAGSRTCSDIDILHDALNEIPWHITKVICGCARGVDTLGEKWAKIMGIPVEYYPADWDQYGKSAGYRRNVEMAKNAEALLAIWDGESSGTKHMIKIAKEHNLKLFVYFI